MSTRLLVSVRTLEEALLVADNGADFIDLKEPRHGALGGLPPATVRSITSTLRARGCTLPISATIGDRPMHALQDILQRCTVLRGCGVDYVKVGIEPVPGARAVLDALAQAAWPLLPDASPHRPAAIVPVFIADQGIDFDAVRQATVAAHAFPALMLDTADKQGGSLFDRVPMPLLQRFVHAARQGGALVGLAGALRLQHLPALAALAPDFAGFRSAVCAAGRGSALDVQRLRQLRRELQAAAAAAAAATEAVASTATTEQS